MVHHFTSILDIQNTILVNLKWPVPWKHSLINRIPKKNFTINDLSTLRDISLIPVAYKIMSKAICERIKPFIEPVIAFWQRAFLTKRDRQELIFTLKTAIDDFRHLSKKFFLVFVDFADAFGSVRHDFMFSTLNDFHIPMQYCCLIEDLYRYSTFSVLCGFRLSKTFYIVRGTKTGDPLSALLFILVVDKICKPMLTYSLIEQNLENERAISPLPVQAYADDIVSSAHSLPSVKGMFRASEPIMDDAGLDVKVTKSGVFYGRRSGNNWYTGKNDVKPVVCIQGKELEIYDKSKPYKYLGKSLALTGEDPDQIKEFIDDYKNLVVKIKQCKLPLALKSGAFNNMALAKMLHHFYNTRLSEKQLTELDKYLTENIRELYELYKSTTQLIIYLPREYGGIGIKKLSDVYYVSRLSFLIKMLNHDIPEIKHVARSSLDLDMSKRGVPLEPDSENFLGYKLNDDGFLDTHTQFGCQSDWPDMVRYARKLDVSVIFNDNRACVKFDGNIYSSGLRIILNKRVVKRNLELAKSLAIQGKFLAMPNIQVKASHSVLYNWNIDDILVKFCMKARLNILPTEYTKYLWNRDNDPICRLCKKKREYMCHVLNGCDALNNFYSRRHDRIVDKLADELKLIIQPSSIHVNKLCESVFPALKEKLQGIQHRKPDILVMLNNRWYVIELTVCYDTYFDFAYDGKVERYGDLLQCLNSNGVVAELLVMCFGSLGCIRVGVHNNLRKLGFVPSDIKSFLSWASLSCIIGANYVWRHRVKKIFNN